MNIRIIIELQSRIINNGFLYKADHLTQELIYNAGISLLKPILQNRSFNDGF